MGNYELKSELSSLEMELGRLKQINAELRGELSVIVNGVSSADNELTNYNTKINNSLENCGNVMASSHHRVVDAVALQGEIENLYTRFKRIELANKKIRECNNRRYYDFSNFRTVRKIVQGIMDNIDVNIVSDKTIAKSVEVQHLKCPDYWLTCVLISIMAWRSDDKELAERALERAVSLDKKSSAIFYMIFNLRMHREEAALKWFFTYQECELKGSDQRTFLMLFSLVSKTISDNIDDNTKDEISVFIKKVIDMNLRESGESEDDIVLRIKNYYRKMQPSDRIEYSMLKKCCGEYDELLSNMMQAKSNINILEFILSVVNVPEEQKNTFLKEYIDELIDLPNDVEKDVYDEIALNELIIKYDGDADSAREQFEKEKLHKEEELNLVDEMIDWIYERDSQEINGQIKLSMFTLTKALQEKAVESHAEEYRSRRKNQLPVTVDGYSTVADFNDKDGEYRKISSYYKEKKNAEKSAIKSWPAYVGFGVSVAALIGCFFAGYWLLALVFGGTGFGMYKLFNNMSKTREIDRKYKENIRRTREIMDGLFDEFSRYNSEFDEYDAYYAQIKEVLAEI